MRGKPLYPVCARLRHRIIPAHAGQTRRLRHPRAPMTDHPRACGANPRYTSSPPRTDGSSPRMRGKPADKPPTVGQQRIIPAHAGQTCPRVRLRESASDHPRACGANRHSMIWRTLCGGSSPRMRGKLLFYPLFCGIVRIIPAHAGQTGY